MSVRAQMVVVLEALAEHGVSLLLGHSFRMFLADVSKQMYFIVLLLLMGAGEPCALDRSSYSRLAGPKSTTQANFLISILPKGRRGLWVLMTTLEDQAFEPTSEFRKPVFERHRRQRRAASVGTTGYQLSIRWVQDAAKNLHPALAASLWREAANSLRHS